MLEGAAAGATGQLEQSICLTLNGCGMKRWQMAHCKCSNTQTHYGCWTSRSVNTVSARQQLAGAACSTSDVNSVLLSSAAAEIQGNIHAASAELCSTGQAYLLFWQLAESATVVLLRYRPYPAMCCPGMESQHYQLLPASCIS